MAKNKLRQSWVTMTKDGVSITVPMNRAARKAYKSNNKDEFMLPAILRPYEKGESDASEIGKKQQSKKL